MGTTINITCRVLSFSHVRILAKILPACGCLSIVNLHEHYTLSYLFCNLPLGLGIVLVLYTGR